MNTNMNMKTKTYKKCPLLLFVLEGLKLSFLLTFAIIPLMVYVVSRDGVSGLQILLLPLFIFLMFFSIGILVQIFSIIFSKVKYYLDDDYLTINDEQIRLSQIKEIIFTEGHIGKIGGFRPNTLTLKLKEKKKKYQIISPSLRLINDLKKVTTVKSDFSIKGLIITALIVFIMGLLLFILQLNGCVS